MSEAFTHSPISTGLQGRCLRCAEGSLFDGYLEFAKACPACGLNLDIEDAGDGPAVFVIFIVGFLVIPIALGVHLAADWPIWLTAIVWLPIMLLCCMALLRPLRGLMLNLQIKNSAAEARLDASDNDGDGSENSDVL